MTDFMTKLLQCQQTNKSWLCVGLDPHPDYLPENVDLLTFGRGIIESTSDLVCAYKFNLAFFLAYGPEGFQALKDIMVAVPDSIPVVLDAKFGDIGYTAERYGKVAFEVLPSDAVTVSPYVGLDAVEPLLAYEDRAVYVLVRSANRSGNDFQQWPNHHAPLYRFVVAQLNTLSQKYPNQLGAGVASTQARDLAQIRCWAPNLPFLIPGVGAQEGDTQVAVDHGQTRSGVGPMITAARSIMYAGAGKSFAEEARVAAQNWRQHIRDLSAGDGSL